MSFLYTLRKISFDFKPHYYQQDVDDIFILFTSPEHSEAFQNFLNCQRANISFAICEDSIYHL